jgi:hypothetical protein
LQARRGRRFSIAVVDGRARLGARARGAESKPEAGRCASSLQALLDGGLREQRGLVRRKPVVGDRRRVRIGRLCKRLGRPL